MSWKQFRVATGSVVAAALALTLSACGVAPSQGDPTTLSTDPVTISVNWWGSDDRQARTTEVIKLFEQKYPNITVKPQFADWSGYWDKLATATAGNTAPDVMQMDEVYLSSYASRGALADLGPLHATTDGIPSTVLDTGKVDDKQYAVPLTTATVAMLVNTDLLTKIGVPLPPNTDTWTWDEYDAWAQKVTKAAPSGTYGASIPAGAFQLQLFARQLGGQLFRDGKLAITQDQLAQWFAVQKKLSESGAAAPASVWSETSTLPLAQSTFATGKVATTANSASIISALSAASKANIELVPFPQTANASPGWNYFKAGMYWTVSSRSTHQAEATAFINFFDTDPAAAKILGAERGLPASTTTLAEAEPSLAATDKQAVTFSNRQAGAIGPAPAITPNGASTIETVLIRYTQDVLFDKQTPDQAAAAFIKDMSSTINSAG